MNWANALCNPRKGVDPRFESRVVSVVSRLSNSFRLGKCSVSRSKPSFLPCQLPLRKWISLIRLRSRSLLSANVPAFVYVLLDRNVASFGKSASGINGISWLAIHQSNYEESFLSRLLTFLLILYRTIVGKAFLCLPLPVHSCSKTETHSIKKGMNSRPAPLTLIKKDRSGGLPCLSPRVRSKHFSKVLI